MEQLLSQDIRGTAVEVATVEDAVVVPVAVAALSGVTVNPVLGFSAEEAVVVVAEVSEATNAGVVVTAGALDVTVGAVRVNEGLERVDEAAAAAATVDADRPKLMPAVDAVVVEAAAELLAVGNVRLNPIEVVAGAVEDGAVKEPSPNPLVAPVDEGATSEEIPNDGRVVLVGLMTAVAVEAARLRAAVEVC